MRSAASPSRLVRSHAPQFAAAAELPQAEARSESPREVGARTALDESQRVADAYARDAIHDHMRRRFYPLTPANIAEAVDWQDAGLRELDRTVAQ